MAAPNFPTGAFPLGNISGGNFSMGNFSGGNFTWDFNWDFPAFPDISVYLYIELVYMMIIFLIGSPGNLLIIIVQAKNPRKSTTDYYVMVMAMYEFVCSSFNVPVSALRNHNLVWPYVGNTFLCVLTSFSFNFTLIASSLHLTAIAVDRCIKTCWPLNEFYNETVAKRMCFLILLVSLFFGVPYGTMFHWDDTWKACVHIMPEPLVDGQFWGRVVTSLGAVLFVIMFISYLLITLSLRKRHFKKVMQRRKKLGKGFESNLAKANVGISITTTNQEDFDSAPATSCSVIESETTDMSYTTDTAATVTASPHTDAPLGTSNPEADKDTAKTNGKERKKKKVSRQTKADKALSNEAKNLNKLTFIMFMITLVYMGTYIVNWLLYILGPFAFGFGFFILCFSIPLINCTTNAIMFFIMSSRFRANAKKIVCGR